MHKDLLSYFKFYPVTKAPFMHKQFIEWGRERPLAGLKVLHNVPLVMNTLLKIACLVAAGAEVVVTNPGFMLAKPEAISALRNANIPYVDKIESLNGKDFDLYFDCGGELYKKLASPKIGSIELTGSGNRFYRKQLLDFPVVSIDETFTKQLETLFGSSKSVSKSIEKLTGVDVSKKKWLIFGFGKIGRGIAYYCYKNNVSVHIVDTNLEARLSAESLGLKALDPRNIKLMQSVLLETDIVITATGEKSILDIYPKIFFEEKILANMGVLDEYGVRFDKREVLNNKLPVNFVLDDPTAIEYIDPEFYAHNMAALELLNRDIPCGVNTLSKSLDEVIIQKWCQYHDYTFEEVAAWFIKMYAL